jgi:ATP-dependent DNA helicase PIF1
MTLDALIEWIDAAMQRLPKKTSPRAQHVRRLYAILDARGCDWSLRSDWHALAVKVARLVKARAPEEPEPPSKDAQSRERKVAPAPEEKKRTWGREKRAGRSRELVKKPAREVIEVNAQLQAAFDAVAANRPILFVTGGAGTGKSTFIRELRARFPDKQSVVLAPTGVAALNAGGQTIHSFCQLPLRPFMPGDARAADDPNLVKALDLVIIDEISMVRADVLDGIDAFLRLNRKSNQPFGGVQMVLVGDLFQLPPVVTPHDRELITSRYATPQFFSAHALRGLKFFPVELEIVYRQRDASFAQMLARIRDGEGAGDAIRQLNAQCVGRALDGQHLILVPTRKAAASENDARLAELPGPERAYTARREGSFETAPDDRLPAPPRLALRKRAQVMFVRNDVDRRWVNGTLGTVEELHDKSVRVRVDDGSSFDVERIEWQDVRYGLNEEKRIVEEVAGTYEQFPLMPAWAVTIHKAQGLTLSRVLVDLDRGAFAEGQVYVALSRCQTLDGLSLRRAVRSHEVRCSESARAFYARMRGRRD